VAKKEGEYMNIDDNDLKPIFVKIAEGIEDDILNEILSEEEQAYSQNQIAKQFAINPATALKGLNILVDEGILYKKRGVGMYVATGAREQIMNKRKQIFLSKLLREIILEAGKLNISKEEVVEMLDKHEGWGLNGSDKL
jgi:DNA-binding transcriptional regulator YhcF (GntR family)